MDKDGWKSLVDQMANNGANATSEEFDTITTYLGGSATTNDAPGTVTPQQ